MKTEHSISNPHSLKRDAQHHSIMKQDLFKNIYAAIVTLFITLFALPTTAQAQTKYKLWIAGRQVTSENCNSISNFNGVSGKVSYVPDSKTLILDNATISASGKNEGVKSTINGLTIHIKGNNTITTNAFTALKIEESRCTITGGGMVNLSGKQFGLYAMLHSYVTIDNCEIDCDGSFGTSTNAEITINNSNITAKGKKYATMRGIQKFTLNSCTIVQPSGAYYDLTLRGIVHKGKLVRDKVIIKANKPILRSYDLRIVDTEVTSQNCNSISNFNGVSGRVSYDPNTKTLTLDNATIVATGNKYGIYSKIDGLTIRINGTCTITAKESPAIMLQESHTTITGGKLKLSAEFYALSPFWKASVIIDNCEIESDGSIGTPNINSEITINNSTVSAYGKNEATMRGFQKFTLNGCAIIQPSDAYYDYKGIIQNGKEMRGKLVIGTNNTLQRRKRINAGLADINYNASALINHTMYNDNENYPEAIESLPDRDFAYLLDKRENKFSEKEIYVRGSGYENIYPGAILIVDDQITSGSPNPLGRIPRSKISIYGDFLAGGNPSQNNIYPNNSDVRMAINNIMHTLLSDSRYDAPGVQRPRTKIHTSQKSLMMDLGVDASFAGCNVNVRASATSSEQSFIQATTLDQDYFTIKLKDDWRQNPASLFGDEVTWEELQRVLNGKAIAIVTSVTYGRTFSYMKEYSAKQFTFDSSQKVSGYGQSADASQSLAESSSYTNDEIFNLGGTALTISALRGKRTQAELEAAMADNMKFSRSNQGVITKYTLQLITGPYPGRVVRPLYSGTQYQVGYTKCPRRLSAHIDVSRVHIGSGKVKVQLDVQCFRVNDKGEVQPTKKVNGGSPDEKQDPWYYTFSYSQNREYGDLQPGEYIYKGPLLRIRSKRGGGSYTADDQRRLTAKEMETGALNIVLSGNVRSHVKILRLEPFIR
ncbi:MAG: thiol-activated cytolysin family protein [Tannerella sp.]|uniref:thiol-activated cytolysin family protein n=1 Tax=Tannerella sp. TaxID=2382127 RepID=UPI003FA2F636